MRAQLTINGQSLATIFAAASSVLQDELSAEMAEILRGQGFAVERPEPWETVPEICRRLEIHPGTFSRKVSLPSCPKPFAVIRDGRGIKQLRSHSVLDAFLRAKTNHRKSAPTGHPQP